MIRDILAGKTKADIIEWAKTEHNVELDSSNTKQKLIRELESMDLNLPEVEVEVDLNGSEVINIEKTEVTVEEEEKELVIDVFEPFVESFKPLWAPTYRHNGKFYYPISKDLWVRWCRGERNTNELLTIEHWIIKNGSLLVNIKEDKAFVELL